jgi:hypothetical protein
MGLVASLGLQEVCQKNASRTAATGSRVSGKFRPSIGDLDVGEVTGGRFEAALALNLRGLNGERFRFHCPPGKPLPGASDR